MRNCKRSSAAYWRRRIKIGRGVGRALIAFCLTCLATSNAAGHPLAPALLELREDEAGRVHVLWRTPARLPRTADGDFQPRFPAACRSIVRPLTQRERGGLATRWELDCGASLAGQEIEIRNLDASGASALVRIQLADGRQFQRLLDPRLNSLSESGGTFYRIPARSDPSTVFRDYVAVGWRHILSGFDHLLFVLGLMLWIRGRRLLLLTITAFTFGHSVTLSLGAVGWVRLPQAPIEALIALSIAALAVELLRAESRSSASLPAVARGRPPILAALFGLLHGLGFAGALAEIGLPQDEIALSLVSFNIGIELGQLAFIATLLAIAAAISQFPALASKCHALRRVPPYVIGSLAAFWFYEHLFSM